MHQAQRPDPAEHNPYYGTYIRLVPDGDVLETLAREHGTTQALLRPLSDEQASWRPAPEEWSVKQVVGHLIDAEYVFAHRALWFARGEAQALPGFDQVAWMESCRFDARSLADLLDEWAHCRAANGRLFAGLGADQWLRGGVASGSPSTVRTWIWGIAGHELHHRASLETVYLAQMM